MEPERDTPWLIRVDGAVYRWTIWADDNGLELRVLDNDHGGSLLVVKGLSFEKGVREWRPNTRAPARFTSLPENKVAGLIREARSKGWRFDIPDQTFNL